MPVMCTHNAYECAFFQKRTPLRPQWEVRGPSASSRHFDHPAQRPSEGLQIVCARCVLSKPGWYSGHFPELSEMVDGWMDATY